MNKIKYGIQNVYYAKAVYSTGSDILLYSAPVKWNGAVSLSLEAQGDSNIFYADNISYFTTEANNGYQGDFESALIPDTFRQDILGETLDAKGFYVENADAKPAEFALLFQFEGDESSTRHVLYRCIASRPATTGSTKEASVEPQTETIQITAMPRISDHVIKARCPYSSSTSSAYQTWFTAVNEPTA